MTPEPINPLAPVRALLVQRAAGYLRNVCWGYPGLCTYCAGVPKSPDFSTCYQCEDFAPRPLVSDRRGFVSYAIEGTQSASLMYRYKDKNPPQLATQVMTLMSAYTLRKHMPCAEHPLHGPPESWAVVPSLRGRPVHPLRLVVKPWLDPLPEAHLRAAPAVNNPRMLEPSNFIADPVLTRGRHVLLIDDAWLGGGHAESAAAALKMAGAAAVTLLILARWLSPGRGATAAFLRSAAMNPDVCPFPPNLVCEPSTAGRRVNTSPTAVNPSLTQEHPVSR